VQVARLLTTGLARLECGGILSAQYVLRAIQRRWRLVLGIFLLTCVAVGIFVFGRKHHTSPVRYRSTATVRVAERPQQTDLSSAAARRAASTSTTVPKEIALGGPEKFALRSGLRTNALRAAHLKRSSHIGFSSKLSDDESVLSLTVTAPSRVQSEAIAKAWAKTYRKARVKAGQRKIIEAQHRLEFRVRRLHDELRRIDAQLVKLMPLVYHGILRFDAPNGNFQGRTGADGPPPVPETGTVYGLNLAYERIALLDALSTAATKSSEYRIGQVDKTANVIATLMAQTPGERVAKSAATTLPALGGLLGGLILALAAALLVDRADRTIRDPEEAALTFGAPVLSIIPSDGEEFAVLAEPNSLAAEAYRGLAAMSIATDRLPRAMMVTTPTGEAHAQVAANLAAALSRLGLKVALMAMSVEQDWYLEAFSPGGNGMTRLPELLQRAHTGTLPAGWRDQLPATDFAPNLVVVPPADEPLLHLPIDGLPALLQELSEGGVDVTVIAGPPLLEEADATIVAWATRNVLWAIIPGEVTRAEARAAAARMELAGVQPFGVVMIEPQTAGV
jgi:Mrp family chromosome partitioning ATPase